MYSWGEGARGQLAQHLQGDDGGALLLEPRAAALSLGPAQVLQQVACGQEHTVVLDADGKVWTCGWNSAGQLGRRKDKDRTAPAVVKGLGGVVGVACGQEHCLALCESGQVFAWGRSSEGQLGIGNTENHITKPREVSTPRLQCMPIPIVQVACGNQHSLALTVGGDVYSWGVNRFGQLGHPKEVSTLAIPSRIQSLTGVPVTQICAGGEHSLVLGLSGLVYCCGANGSGQLGLNRVDEKGRFNVCVVPALRELSISSISCGEAHTAVLTQDGSVFTFGEGSYGQLGHNSTANELRPRRVESLEGQAAQIACGSHHTLVLMSSGLLLAFGSGLKGQLGNGDTDGRLVPSPVRATWRHEGAAGHSGMKISSGWNTNFIYSVPAETVREKAKICKIDKEKLQTWITLDPNNEDIEEIKREVALIFSSSSSLVASFMRCSASESTSDENPDPVRVDLNAARQIFQQLQEIPWLNQQISVQSLVKSVFLASQTMISVDIFLVLPECHLFHEDQNIVKLVLPLARAILQLPDSSMKHLKEQWSLLKLDIVIKHIHMWKQALSYILRSGLLNTLNTPAKEVLGVLKHLYESSVSQIRERAADAVPADAFYIEDVCSSDFLLEDAGLWYDLKQTEDTEKTPVIFCRFPFTLDLQSKLHVFNYVMNIPKLMYRSNYQAQMFWLMNGVEPLTDPAFQLCVRRSELVKDTFRQLKSAEPENFAKDLVVRFIGDFEQPFVNKKDFFLHIFECLFAPDFDMFMQNDSGTLLWFPVKRKMSRKKYFLFGVLCGLALYNNTMVYLPFPLALFKKLLNLKPTLEDLKELSPVVGKSLQYLLDYSDDDVENMDMCYSVVWNDVEVELDPDEKGKLVTSNNKHDFVNVYVDYVLNKSAEKLFEEFRKGFFTVCDMVSVKLFQPKELMEVMMGNEDYDWDRLRQNTTYEGKYHQRHPNIIRFWEVFNDLTEDQKKAFLLFVTGSARVPVLGMDHIKMRVVSLPTFTKQHYPEAITCHTILHLPVYRSKELFKAKLTEAISHNRGFWKD
ncbi:E3 ISG15--protein ligase Herc6-like [Scleropages formosus]|uniref:E3 ISG15--protein ligase Herc6-like n=1 Tax=Scleropages formosus TaxID=113540 RepID=UPI0010FA8038|nr:E3 ISG15--protein ligase Herc6-like [Scleropages formosus]